jgi:hypothetical protein
LPRLLTLTGYERVGDVEYVQIWYCAVVEK